MAFVCAAVPGSWSTVLGIQEEGSFRFAGVEFE